MALLDIVRDIFKGFFQGLGTAWWVEITTAEPRCTYYFGPFQSSAEAEAHKPGYVEDLESERAQGIQAAVKRCNPDVLTVFDEMAELPERSTPVRSLSGQFH